MKKLAMVAFLVTSACASQISLPVVGKLSNGDTAQGNVTVDLVSYEGTFNMVTLRGLECSGQYDAKTSISTILIPVSCNNGQTGTVIATRDASKVAGTATAKLKNGMSGRFLFGNVSAQQQAEFLN